jgi:hypothetical protein
VTGLLCAISALLGAAVGMWWGGIRGALNERQRAAIAADKAYTETKERMNEIRIAPDADAARDSLRARLNSGPLHGIGSADE